MASLSGDTVIKLFDGTYKTIEQLSKSRKTIWIHSTDIKTEQVNIAIAKNPRMIGKRKKIIRVTFDNDKSIICSINQKFLMRTMTYRTAEEIKNKPKKGRGLSPLYYKPYKEMSFDFGKLNPLYKAFLDDKEYKVYEKMGMHKSFPKVRYAKQNYDTPGKHMINYLYDFTDLHRKSYGKLVNDPRTGLPIAMNHKIKKIEYLVTDIPVYTIAVKENFAVDLGDNSCIFLK